ncbi:NAD-binding protein [Mycobacterium tuberculosis]
MDQSPSHRQQLRSPAGAIVGAGGIGCGDGDRLARGLGASVTLLARGSGLLPRMEPFVGELIGRGLADAGVDVRVGVSVRALGPPPQPNWPSGPRAGRRYRAAGRRCSSPPAEHRRPTTSAGANRTDAGQLAGRR